MSVCDVFLCLPSLTSPSFLLSCSEHHLPRLPLPQSLTFSSSRKFRLTFGALPTSQLHWPKSEPKALVLGGREGWMQLPLKNKADLRGTQTPWFLVKL